MKVSCTVNSSQINGRMPQQTRIDQFYKSTISKRTSKVVTNIKKNAAAKSTPYSRNRKKFNNGRRNISFSQDSVQSDTMPECTFVYETLGKTCNIDLVNIEESNELSLREDDYLEGSSNPVAGIKHESRSFNETVNTRNTKAWNNNETYSTTPKKKLANPSSTMQLEGIEEGSSSSIHLKETPTKKLRTPDKSPFLPADSNSTSASKKSNYSLKVASAKSQRNIAVKKLFLHIVDAEVVKQAIECMNLAKQGAILPNNFDLEEIYSKGTFVFQYSPINTKALTKYELNDITYTDDLKSQVLVATIFTVFSNPVNCGYFSENELDFIYSIITLPKKAQMLLARMIRRKNTLYRKSGIDYPEIDSDLRNTFEILASRSICTFDTENENLSTLLDLLQVDELQRLCRNMKTRSNGRKEKLIAGLINLSKKKSLFLGIKTPQIVLYTNIRDILDYCVRITDRTWQIVEKILTLLIPNRDPQESMADKLYELFDVYQENIIFPKTPANRFPLFSCQLDVVTYIEVKSMLTATLKCIEKKNWEKVREYGNLAMDKLPDVLKGESLRLKNSALPMHVRRFMPGYVWLKILSQSIDAFKKDNDKNRAVEALNFLLEQDCHMRTRKGKWYSELALIKMFHFKDAEASALITKQALKSGILTQVDKIDLIERAKKILKKKTGVKSNTKMEISTVLNDHIYEMPYEAALNTIDASLMPGNTAGNKNTWRIESSDDSQSYGSVESLALYHYCEGEFSNGLHCEGRLPILLFVTLFWEELYDIHIPGAFVTQYQSAPEDLFTEQFYENRKEQIDMKLQIINNLRSESLSNMMEERFKQYSQYQSIMPSDLLKSSVQLKEIVHCLGVQAVTGICKRLYDNYRLWRSGFPDLIVWNFDTKKHKIVEVKGPKDTLSTKQRLWLGYLSQLGLNTEVCLVQEKHGAKRSKKTIQVFNTSE
ncbi:fanconi-associated nuclease 1 [Andrena cerasifolii]|uniref:fanconi-associated nuclease 1 n=1 Tax=Andrena cerasifolii TaxID=2819439 RepID=UPI0040382B3A